jgi:hypothetical protein
MEEKLARELMPVSAGWDNLALPKVLEDAVELGGVDVKAGFGPDDVIGFEDFGFDGELRGDAVLDFFGRPTAVKEALMLSSG